MGVSCSKPSVSRASPPVSEPRRSPTASVVAEETRVGARGLSGVLARIPPSDTASPFRKRLRSGVPEDVGDAKRIKDVGSGGVPDPALLNDDGQSQLASACLTNERAPESLLFSCRPLGAASDMVVGPSGSVQPTSLFKLDRAKHKIFLSHSRAQKDFVEQLCVDLERKGYFFPFFDQRHHSLPKGEDFAPLIIEAAQLCHVAVIVLSKEFLCSKWPMIELVEFYDAQQGAIGTGGKLKLLLLFFKLSIEEVKDEGHWMPIWEAHVACDPWIDLSKWSVAMKVLCKSNGLEFEKFAMKEVAYREGVVKSIFELSPPDLFFGSFESMVGYGRMCEAMSRRFVEDPSVGARVLGIYGMARLGKSILAKALLDYFYGEFMGKVCYVDMRHGSRVRRQKWMLKMLCGFERDMMDYIGASVEKGWKQLETFIKRERVFLVLDNVTNDAHLLKEVHDYLKMGFHPKSRILITSSSQAILEDLLSNMQSYTPMPTLTNDEAKALFLKHAAPMKAICELTMQEQNILGVCIQKCWFDSLEGGSYHVVALIALANFFSQLDRREGNQILVWKDHLEKELDLVKDVLKSSKDLFGILGLQFSTFDFSEKLLFLDLALFSRVFDDDIPKSLPNGIAWLCQLHDESPTIIRGRLMNLRNSGMINFDPQEEIFYNLDDDINVPTLYEEFAEWYATDHKVNGLKNAWGVFDLGRMNLGVDSSTPIRSWSNLIWLRIFDMTFANTRLVTSKKMQKLSNLVVLQLSKCRTLTMLNLEGLDCLRELQLKDFPQLEIISLSGNSNMDDYGGIYYSLQDVLLESLPSLIHMPDLRPCTSLHTVTMVSCERVTNLEAIDCPSMKRLDIFWLYSNHFEKLLAFNCLHSLEELRIEAESNVDDFDGHWRQIVDERDVASICEAALEGEGPCAKFLDELCQLLDGSSNMICIYFHTNHTNTTPNVR